MSNNINMYKREPKYVKFSTFIITCTSLIVIFIISLICVIIYYENELDKQVTDITFIPYDSEDNLTITSE